MLLLLSQYPKSRAIVFRQTYIDLSYTTRRTFKDKVCPASWVKRDVKESTTLQNDSEITWMHLDSMTEQSLRGLEINFAFGDQVEEIDPELLDVVDSRLGRWQLPLWGERCPPYLWMTSNPKGHDSVYYRFDPKIIPYTRIEHFKEWDDAQLAIVEQMVPNFDRKSVPPTVAAYGEHKAYFFGSTFINLPKLNEIEPTYVSSLLRKPLTWQKQWLYGSRDFFEGSIHPTFKESVHVYDPQKFNPFAAGKRIRRVMGWFDYGISHPTVLLLSAMDEEGFHYFFHEYGAPNRTIAQHAENIRKLIGQHNVEAIFADPMVFYEMTRDRKVMTKSIAEEYAMNGVQLLKADNNEDTSIEKIEEMLNIDPARMNPVTRTIGSPRVFFSADCKNAIQQIQLQRRKEERNALTGEKEFCEERDPAVPDDFYDPVRYWANCKTHDYRAYSGPIHVPNYANERTGREPLKAGYR